MSNPAVQTAGISAPTSVFQWPDGFDRVPSESWAHSPVDASAINYDKAGGHSWYKNLEPLTAQVLATLDDGLLIEYSCGTGILADRLQPKLSDLAGVLNVDASAKFLRLAVEKFGNDRRFAFRLLNWLGEESRLQLLDEVTEPGVLDRGADILTSANAIHLYTDLKETILSWHRCMKSGAKVFVGSANIYNPSARPGDLILDETVARINELAAEVVYEDPLFEEHRDALSDSGKMASHEAQRDQVFVPVRRLDTYLDVFSAAGFDVLQVFDQTIFVPASEFCQALSTYHDAVLGWVGGTVKVEGQNATRTALRDRLFLIKYCLEKLSNDNGTFPCSWTYITCRRR